MRADPANFHTLSLAPQDEDGNLALLRSYLKNRLPVAYRQPEQIELILAKTQGLFLYAYHMAQALDSGVFANVQGLPAAHDFYPAYLAQLRDRVGHSLYTEVYLKTLLCLCAVQAPITLAQLESWGVAGDRLRLLSWLFLVGISAALYADAGIEAVFLWWIAWSIWSENITDRSRSYTSSNKNVNFCFLTR
ncbi:MAG: hypothetical protein ACI9VI_001064 [Candidatus Azotimanducaceae bacterium]